MIKVKKNKKKTTKKKIKKVRKRSLKKSKKKKDPTRNCKVIALYLGERRRWPLEKDAMVYVVNRVLEQERVIDSGVDMDVILVISKSGHIYEQELLSRDGMPVKRGRLRVIERENSGLSFGAYNAAFERFRDEYDYWFFSEDDYVPIKDGYYLRAMKDLNEDPEVAFVAGLGLGVKWGPHAHGGIGLTHIKYLNEAYKLKESLPYHPGNIDIKKARKSLRIGVKLVTPHLEHGEMAFTNVYVKMGYKIVVLGMKGSFYDIEKEKYLP